MSARAGGAAGSATGARSAGTVEHYRSAFERRENGARANGHAWPGALRRGGIERFGELGFPTTRQEDWKFTDVSPIARVAFEPAPRPADSLVTLEALAPSLLAGVAARLVFVNGWFAPALSTADLLPDGLRAESLAGALACADRELEPVLGRLADAAGRAFAALNLAFLADGAWVRADPGVILEQPIHLLFVSTAAGGPTVSSPRNLIQAGAGSQIAVVESYAGLGREPYLTNAVTEIVLEEDAIVDHVKLQEESERAFHVAAVAVRQGRASRFHSHSISLGGALVRNDLDTVFDDEGGECRLNGLYMVGGRQHVDNHTSIDHARPHCTSLELYKGVLDGRARAVFNGKIIVRPDAQKTNARQTNKNLVLSDDTGVNSKPELEIFANDVKCAHGATVGQVDRDALFYLRSRGLSAAAARDLLTYAFASEIVDEVRLRPVRDHLVELLARRLPGGPAAAAEIAT